jgi:hypothetical protein
MFMNHAFMATWLVEKMLDEAWAIFKHFSCRKAKIWKWNIYICMYIYLGICLCVLVSLSLLSVFTFCLYKCRIHNAKHITNVDDCRIIYVCHVYD